MARRDEGAYPQRSVTEEQRSQTAFCPKTLRAAGLLPVARVGSLLTARCGDARNSPPWPRPKSLAAGPLLILKQTLKAQDGSAGLLPEQNDCQAAPTQFVKVKGSINKGEKSK